VAPILTVQGLRKRFGARQAVDDVSFQIGRGETYGLLGPNGGLAIVRFRRVLLAGG
jgi:ABC-type multidrug transport system ATPase subunit